WNKSETLLPTRSESAHPLYVKSPARLLRAHLRSLCCGHETRSCNKVVSRPAGRRVTVRDIAAHTGVSIATVSRVLNGQAHVAPETRELVQQAAERLRARGPGSRTGSAR